MEDPRTLQNVAMSYWMALSPSDKRSHAGIGIVTTMVILLSVALLGATLHILHTVDDDNEHVNENLHRFVMAATYAALVGNLVLPSTVGTPVVLILLGIAAQIGMIVMIRTELRPNADALDVSVPEIDTIEYGTYTVYGAMALVGIWYGYNRSTITSTLGTALVNTF